MIDYYIAANTAKAIRAELDKLKEEAHMAAKTDVPEEDIFRKRERMNKDFSKELFEKMVNKFTNEVIDYDRNV